MQRHGIRCLIIAGLLSAALFAATDSAGVDVIGIGLEIFCPPDITVGCNESTLPEATGAPSARTDCFFQQPFDDEGPGGNGEGNEAFYFEFEDEIEAGECAGEFTILRTWSVYDQCEEFASCTQRIFVVDTEAPSLNCQLPPLLELPPTAVIDAQTCVSQVPDLREQASVTDACDQAPTVTQSPAPGSFFTNAVTVVLRAEDDCGNVSEATCELLIQCQLEGLCHIRGTICLLPADFDIVAEEVDEFYRCLELSGVVVRLVQLPGSNVVDEASTDGNGVFQFDVQPLGEYLLEVDETTLPPGVVLFPLAHNPGQPFTYDPLATFCPEFDIVYQPTLGICGVVWFDQNGNGTVDESLLTNGLNGVNVRLRLAGSGTVIHTSTTATDTCTSFAAGPVSGVFGFGELLPGTYLLEVDPVDVSAALVDLLNSISFSVPPGFVMTTPQTYQVICGPFACEVFDAVTGQPAMPNFGMRYEPTAITLASLEAVRAEGGVHVRWRTAMEIDNLGFFVHRADAPDGARTRVHTDLIPGQGTGEGETYAFFDEAAPDGVLYYWVEDIDWSFVSTLHGPVEAAAESADEGGARIVRMEWGNPLVLWSRGLPGAAVLPQWSGRIAGGAMAWSTVPASETDVYGDLYRSAVPLPEDVPAGFLRVLLHVLDEENAAP